MNLLVTGTDTNVGKTHVTAGLVRASRAAGLDVIGMKPFCTGDQTDTARLQEANGAQEPDHLINPAWFHTPLAPLAAAAIENRHIDLAGVQEAFRELTSRHAHVLVEGAGGLAVPILTGYDFRDLARDLGLDILLVAANRLGALNHVRLTLDALEASSLRCRGVILNTINAEPGLAESTNRSILEQLTTVPIFEVGYGEANLSGLAAEVFRA